MSDRRSTHMAIIGMGSWGLCVLERTVHRALEVGSPLTVHVIEPGDPGGGVYNLEQPDYLLLNNPCGQLSLYASPDPGEAPSYSLGLFEWAVSRGYEWFGNECRTGGGGVPIKPIDYLPRRIMGEYLCWFYEMLVDSAPATMTVVRHRLQAVDIVSESGGRERVLMEDGSEVTVDHVVLTSGHTYNEEGPGGSGIRYLRPYPVDYFASAPAPGEPVGMSGMGLVCFDLLSAFTIGRGGTFEGNGAKLRYVPSGTEPIVYLFSRSGIPYCAKSATGIDPTGDYRPVVCTPEAFAAIKEGRGGQGYRQADFREDVLPILYAEMKARFYCHAALLGGGASQSSLVRHKLTKAWQAGHFDEAVDHLAHCYGRFDPAEHLFPNEGRVFESADHYEQHVYEMISADLDAALHEGGSPVKAALEVTRMLRDDLRSVIEFGGLSLESYLDFQSNVRSRINRIEAGPPPVRSAQLLALIDAGIVKIPFGPAPALEPRDGGMIRIRSTQLQHEEIADVSMVVRAHLDLPSLARSVSPLLSHLYRLGRLSQMSYGDTTVGSVAISEDLHPFDVEGRLQDHISILGVLTEGVRYFTHYLPSPKSRLRAVVDAQACVESVIR